MHTPRRSPRAIAFTRSATRCSSRETMRYIAVDRPGGPDVLRVGEAEPPRPGREEVLIAVEAAGVSHADVMQREGTYPPPPGSSEILGLEVAGTVVGLGAGADRWA